MLENSVVKEIIKINYTASGSTDHLANTCTKRQNKKDRNSMLIEETQENLLSVDEYMSDTESIYSIISIVAYDQDNDTSSDDENDLITDFGVERNYFDFDIGHFMNLECDKVIPNLLNNECKHQWQLEKGLDRNPCSICL